MAVLSHSSPSSLSPRSSILTSFNLHSVQSSSSTPKPPPAATPMAATSSSSSTVSAPPASLSANGPPADPSSFVKLNEGIAHFYDSSSGVWEDIWGEHMHHGFYDPGVPLSSAVSSANHTKAQVRMIEESLKWAGIPDQGSAKPQRIIDVGCGIGGSSRHLARKYGAQVVGITLSPNQARRATDLTASAQLSNKVSFQVADALNQPFPDEHFDFVWSMESGEHMPDKEKFMSELVRVTKPGGRILIVTWCHRELLPDETTLKRSEKKLLDKVCEAYYLPAWCAPSKYVNLAQAMGLQDIKSTDWTEHITPFWPAVMASALSLKGMLGLMKSGWTTIKGAIAMSYMVKGYKTGLIKFALITARKEG